MRVFLKKDVTVGDIHIPKNTEGYLWCCLLHNKSFLISFSGVVNEVPESSVEFHTRSRTN